MRGRSTLKHGVMTDRDFEIVKAVIEYVNLYSRVPSLAGIGKSLQLTRQAIDFRLRSMAKRGLIEERPINQPHFFMMTTLGQSEFLRLLDKKGGLVNVQEHKQEPENVIYIRDFAKAATAANRRGR